MQGKRPVLKNMGAEHRDAASLMSAHLDIARVRTFPDRTSAIPVADQIAADKRAGMVMTQIHDRGGMGPFSADISEKAKAEADKAYLEALRRADGDQAVEEELRRRNDYAVLMGRGMNMTGSEPVAMAKSSVRIVENDPLIAPEHQALRDKLRAAAKMPWWEQEVEVGEALVHAHNHGVASPGDYIRIARLANAARGGRSPV